MTTPARRQTDPIPSAPRSNGRAREAAMYAEVGDRLVVPSVHLDGPVRDAEILEVRHADGGPPYLVRWSDTGHEGLVFPGPEAHVQHFADDGA